MEETTEQTLGAYLTAVRDGRAENVSQVARLSHVDRAYLIRAEAGTLVPSLGALHKLAVYYGLDYDDLKARRSRERDALDEARLGLVTA